MSVERVVDLVRAGERFLVMGHRRPDADAFGSALGWAAFLRAAGKHADVYVPDALAPSLEYLRDAAVVHATLPAEARYDAAFVMDTAARALLPTPLPPRDVRGPLVVVDHHAAHDDVGDVVVRDVGACATGEVVIALGRALGVEAIPADAARPLYAAIVADTGGFHYPTTSAHTLRLGAELLDAGADPWEAAYSLFEGWEPARLRLLSAVIDTLETHLDGRLAILRVTREMLSSLGADDDMVEGLVSYGRALRGVEVAALLWEWPRAGGTSAGGTAALDTKVSLRSQGRADVSVIAVELGGGGHRGAVGAQVEASLDETARLVRKSCARLLE